MIWATWSVPAPDLKPMAVGPRKNESRTGCQSRTTSFAQMRYRTSSTVIGRWSFFLEPPADLGIMATRRMNTHLAIPHLPPPRCEAGPQQPANNQAALPNGQKYSQGTSGSALPHTAQEQLNPLHGPRGCWLFHHRYVSPNPGRQKKLTDVWDHPQGHGNVKCCQTKLAHRYIDSIQR
jgi:hypothetical protein